MGTSCLICRQYSGSECYHIRYRNNLFHLESTHHGFANASNYLKVYFKSRQQIEELIPMFDSNYYPCKKNCMFIGGSLLIDLSTQVIENNEELCFLHEHRDQLRFCHSNLTRVALDNVINKYSLGMHAFTFKYSDLVKYFKV